jgi:hypothetical protein
LEKGIAAFVTYLGEDEFWFLCLASGEKKDQEKGGQGKVRNTLLIRTFQSSSPQSTQQPTKPYFEFVMF